MSTKPNAPSAERNKHAILEVLREEFQDCKTVLEIGSGTGQHATFFGRHLQTLTWQTSDLAVNHDGINAWLKDAELDNVKVPLVLDVAEPMQTNDKFGGVYSANTAHIMGITEVECMFSVVGQCLIIDGRFCLYGPFNQNGEFSSDSNRDFDANLKLQNPSMGIRDLKTLDDFAEANGLHRTSLYAMPSNNMISVWTKN